MREFKPGRKKAAEPPPHEFSLDLAPLDLGQNLDLKLAWEQRNDVGNASRFIARYGDGFAQVEEIGWHAWSGRHWDARSGRRMAQLSAHETARKIYEEAKALFDAGARPLESAEDFQKRIDGLRGFGCASGNSNRITAMLREAEPYLARSPDQMDRDPVLFNVDNGTLRLGDEESGGVELMPHARDHNITKVAPVDYDPEADCPRFHAFLDRVIPSIEMQEFLQRWFGYCLTGLTSEQVLVMFWGKGANGKSVLVDVIGEIIGDYGMGLQFASLLQDDRKRGSEASPDLARLPGARLVVASEAKVGAQFDEGLIKQLTGQDTMNVRHLNRDFFSFKPTFKLVLVFNNKPKVRGQDEGIWRRFVMVPFGVMIPEDERDKHLATKLLKERNGILNWLLDGYRLWVESGLKVPEEAIKAKQEYREQSDPIGVFLGDAVDQRIGARVPATTIYEIYQRWCRVNSEPPVGQKLFGNILSDKGYRRHKSGIQYYEDIAIIDDFSSRESAGGEDD